MASDLWDDFRGKPEKQSYSNQSEQSPWAPQQGYLTGMFGEGLNLYNKGAYSGPFIGGLSPFTSQAQNLTAQRALSPNSLTAQAQGQLGDTISGKFLNPSTNPHFSGMVNDALGQAKSQFLGLYGGNAGSNIGNSGFQEGLTRNLGTLAGNLYSDQFNRERQNQMAALGMAPGLDYANLEALSAVGAQQDARSQAEVQAQQQAWASPWDSLARYQAAITGNYGGVRTGSQEAPWTSQIYDNYQSERDANMNMAGSIGGGAMNFGAAAMRASDIRLKENIKRIGTHNTGVGIYSYNYKGSDVPQMGVLAQELEQVKPEAVKEIGGIKHVNFKMI